MNLQEIKNLHAKILAEKESKNNGSGGDFLQTYVKLEMGKNLIRILPGKTPEQSFFTESVVHKYLDEEGKAHNYYCNKPSSNPCPMCDLVQDLWSTHKTLKLPYGEKSKYGDMATQIKAKPRWYANVVDRRIQDLNDPTQSPVKILAMSKQLFDKIVAAICDPEYQVEGDENDTTILSLDKGNDFVIEMTKKDKYNDFTESKPRIKKSPAGTKQQIDSWMNSLHDISNLNKTGDYTEGKKIAMNLRASLETISAPPTKVEGEDNGVTSETKFKQNLKV